jgi:hypothetical protein
MIGWFPSQYPDELFYSICARYHAMMSYPNRESVNDELFGEDRPVANVDLPRNLDHFTAALPTNQYYTSDCIIARHSLSNLYAPFLTEANARRLRDEMKVTNTRSISRLLNAAGLSDSVRNPQWFRYCPECVISDRREFGETYWHRQHQVPGVEVCTTHELFLNNSCVETCLLPHKGLFPAESSAQLLEFRSLDANSPEHRSFLALARDACWLLSESSFGSGWEVLRYGIAELLEEKKFTTSDGKIRGRLLAAAVRSHYGADFLDSLQCFLSKEPTRHSWVQSFISNLMRNKRSSHPLRFLVMFQFFGLSAESFFEKFSQKPLQSMETQVFGTSPFPCLNPVCTKFRRRVIQSFQVKSDWARIPIGIFSCECGYTYVRRNLPNSHDDIFYKDYTKCHGPVWESALKGMWYDTSLSAIEMCRRLDIQFQRIKWHAVRIGLEFPRVGPNNKVLIVKQSYVDRVLKSRSLKVPQSRIRDAKREGWLAAARKNPNASRTQLQMMERRIYYWLHTHDGEWLKVNTPQGHTADRNPNLKDWESIDKTISQEVLDSASCIRNAFGFPVQVTKSAIAHQIRRTFILTGERSRLPLTHSALDRVRESYEDFALRRIRWALEELKRQGVTVSLSEFCRYAHLSRQTLFSSNPHLRKAADSAIASLNYSIDSERSRAGMSLFPNPSDFLAA